MDSVSAREKGGAPAGRNLVDRGKLGTRYHLPAEPGALLDNIVITGASTTNGSCPCEDSRGRW
jgi:hypothetical protein